MTPQQRLYCGLPDKVVIAVINPHTAPDKIHGATMWINALHDLCFEFEKGEWKCQTSIGPMTVAECEKNIRKLTQQERKSIYRSRFQFVGVEEGWEIIKARSQGLGDACDIIAMSNESVTRDQLLEEVGVERLRLSKLAKEKMVDQG